MNSTINRKDRFDLVSTIVFACAAAVATVVLTVLRLVDLFAVDGIAATARVDFTTEVPLGAGAAAAGATIHELTVTASDIPALSVGAFVTAILATGVAYLVIIGCTLRFCLNAMAGAAFSRTNTRLIVAVALTIIAAAVIDMFGTTMGVNGAFAALAVDAADIVPQTTSAYWVSLFAGVALGAVAVAFRAGERLQREAEGLI